MADTEATENPILELRDVLFEKLEYAVRRGYVALYLAFSAGAFTGAVLYDGPWVLWFITAATAVAAIFFHCTNLSRD